MIYEPMIGETINTATKKMIELAERNKCSVKCTFNSIVIIVDENSSLEERVAYFTNKSKIRHEACPKEYQSLDDLSELYMEMENARINWQNKVISGEYNPEKENPLDENHEKGAFLAWKKAMHAYANAYIKKFTKDK